MNTKKGVTLVETIVAIAVAVVMSVAIYSTCNLTISATAKNRTKSFFANESQNYVKCYFLGESQYSSGIKLLTNQDVVFGDDLTVYYDANYKQTNQENSTYHVDIKFVDDNFEIKCFENANQKLIFEIEV